MKNTFNQFGTPSYPRVPHSTPSSGVGDPAHVFIPRLPRPRPPVQNPFDKFPQDDFDAWIGRLTGDLQRALGYQDEPRPSSVPQGGKATVEPPVNGDDGSLEDDSIIEDSFAEVKARHALNKGKARDPREGPGLGPKTGDKDLPIEILSDEEGGEEQRDAEASEVSYEEDSGDEEEGEYEEGDEEEEEWFGDARSPVANALDPTEVRNRTRYELYAEEGKEFSEEPVEGGSEDERGGEEYDSEYEDEGQGGNMRETSSEEVVELLSDDEVLETGHQISVDNHQRLRPEGEELLSDEEHTADVHPSPTRDDRDLREGGLEEEDEIQPLDDDTSFPPHPTTYKPESRPVDIPDPWAAVAKYAEDYYSGGEIRLDSNGHLDPHHLGPNDDDLGFSSPEGEVEQEGYESVEKGNEGIRPPFARHKVFHYNYHSESPPHDSYTRSQATSVIPSRSETVPLGDLPAHLVPDKEALPHQPPEPPLTLYRASPEIIAIDSEDETEEVALVEREPIGHDIEERTQEEPAVERVSEVPYLGEAESYDDHTTTPVKTTDARREQRNMLEQIHEEVHTALSVLGTQTDEKAGNESPSPPRSPATQAAKTGETLDNIGGVDTNIEVSVEDSQKEQNGAIERWTLPTVYTQGATTSASGRLITPPADQEAFDLGSPHASFPLGAHIHIGHQVADVEEAENEDGIEHPGAFPLMTSDLDYEIPVQNEIENDKFEEAVQAQSPNGHKVSPSSSFEEVSQQPTLRPFETVTPEGYMVPTESIEVVDPDLNIFVEEPEDYINTPPEEIVISVEAATPMIWSKSNSPKVEEELHIDGQNSTAHPHLGRASAAPEPEAIPEIIEDGEPPDSDSAPQTESPAPQESVRDNSAPVDDELTGRDNFPSVVVDRKSDDVVASAQEPTDLTPGSGAVPLEEALRDTNIEIGETVTGADQGVASHTTKSQVSFDANDDQIPYTIEEPLTESEYCVSVAPERDVSISVTSVRSDEVISAMVEKGDIETVSESGEESTIPFNITRHEAHAPAETQSSAYGADAEDVPVTEQIIDELGTEFREQALADMHTILSPSPNPNDYFTQHGSSVIEPLATEWSIPSQTHLPVTPNALPSIINLPGTPHRVLSPASTPGPGPTPVSIPIDPAVLKALRENPNFLDGPTSLPARVPPSTPVPPQPRQPSMTEVSPGTTTPANITTGQQLATSGLSSPVVPKLFSELGLWTDATPSLPPVVEARNPTLAIDPYPYSLSKPVATESSARAATNGTPSSFPVMVARKPTDPVLVADPYPYSLSTPMPPSVVQHGEEEGSEEDLEQENSMTSSSSAEKDREDKEPDNKDEEVIPVNVDELELRYPSELSITGSTRNTPIAVSVIDEFLVRESESDTDADGEADPEFLDVKSSAGKNEVVKQEDMEVNVLHEQDPLKLLGNGSLKAPGEVPDSMPDEEQDKDSTNVIDKVISEPESTIQAAEETENLPADAAPPATTITELGAVLTSEPGQPPSDSVVALSTETKVVPTSPKVPDLNQHVLSYPPVPSRQSSIPRHKTPITELAIPTIHPPETEERMSTLSPGGHKPTSTGAPILQQALATAHSAIQTEDSRRKVHISVEDPYHADNDSDHENLSSSSKPGKRKRSLSNASDREPPSPTKSKPTFAGRGTRKSSGSATKAARSRKDGNKRNATRNVFHYSNAASRSPSIASTIPSDHSFLTQPSPISDRPSIASSEPQPFLHAHSRRKRRNVPTTLQEQQLQKQLKKTPSLPRSRAGTLKAEDVLTKAPSIAAATTSSPVTRSHCRYHKISIPKTEHGPRVFFLVPGCSLTDQTLIVEEEIEDHGEAMIRGDTRIVDDIETLDFEPYLLWVMRQLVGRDIMQENEVFYLPEPNEEVARKPLKPKKKQVSKPQKSSSATAENATDSMRESILNPSRASSAASTISVLQQILGSDIESLSAVTETEDEAQSPTRPRHENGETGGLKRTDQHQEKGSPQTTKGVNKETTTSLRKRVRRLGQDATAYQPSSDESSSEDPEHDASHRKPLRNRGFKRSRLSDANVVEGVEGRKVKRPKTQPSISEEASHAA